MEQVDYRGAFDLLRMLRLTSASWSPAARWHVGDVAWERRLHHAPSARWPTRLWLDDETLPLAWAWLPDPTHLELVVSPAQVDALVPEVVEWASTTGSDEALSTTITEAQGELRAALERAGFREVDSTGFHHLSCRPAEVVRRALPQGFHVRGLDRGEEDLRARVDVHVAAWASTTMSTDVYRRLQRTWPYRHDLDVVVASDAAPDVLLASCLAWLDDAHRVGELEPVGTRPDHRRRGFAAAACVEAVRRLGAAGAETAIVYASADPHYAAPLALYRSIGFEPLTRTVELRSTR
ncbi:MAG TPA: GNAT family N-acetyltransferase [Acidimicrobiales bacterium]|nr:GNAT family N-acetyltransferase [Acidimicrobiales bacterium]